MLALILLAMAFAYFYLQLVLGLPPCPLCIVDRFALVLIGLTLVMNLSLVHYFRKAEHRIGLFSYLLNFVWLGLGIWASVRHIMLQYFPSAQGGCLPYTNDTLTDLLTSAFAGTSDCGVVLWTLGGFSIAEQTFMLFVLLFILNCGLLYTLRE